MNTSIVVDRQRLCLGPTREPECDAAVTSLMEMGFSEVRSSLLYPFGDRSRCFSVLQEKARSALSTMHWNTSDALESLCKS